MAANVNLCTDAQELREVADVGPASLPVRHELRNRVVVHLEHVLQLPPRVEVFAAPRPTTHREAVIRHLIDQPVFAQEFLRMFGMPPGGGPGKP